MTSWAEDDETGADDSDESGGGESVVTTDSTVSSIGKNITDPSLISNPPQGTLNTMALAAEDSITLASLDTVAGQQTALNYTGFGGSPPLHVDNDYGPLSKAATKAFQLSRGLSPDMIWGPATKSAMYGAVVEKDGGDVASALINAGLSAAQAALVANNETNAPASPSLPTLPSSADVAQVNASISASGGVSSSLQPIPVSDLPTQTPPTTYMQKVEDFYTTHKTACQVGGVVAVVGAVALAVKAAR